MKKSLMVCSLVVLLCLTFSCQKQEQVERFMEDGVEVVVNHLEPYKIKGEPSSLHLEELFTIDTEKDDIAKSGLIDIDSFDIDSEGSIYFSSWGYTENVVYKFDKNANFVTSFGKEGQGPGELQFPTFRPITIKDEIPIQDYYRDVYIFFDRRGNILRETKVKKLYFNSDGKLINEAEAKSESKAWRGQFYLYPLENENYLAEGYYIDSSAGIRTEFLYLLDSNFNEMKELDRLGNLHVPRSPMIKKARANPRVFIAEVSNELIYVGNESRGYEVLIYNLEGTLLRKIRKNYIPVDVLDEFKEDWRRTASDVKEKLFFDDKMPPFHYFFLDDEERLYVKTYEKGDKQGEYMHDIFDSNGVFVTRKSMPGYGRWVFTQLSLNIGNIKKHRLYCIREKDSGFKELVVYKMTWE